MSDEPTKQIIHLNRRGREQKIDLTSIVEEFNDISIIEGRGYKCLTVMMNEATKQAFTDKHGDVAEANPYRSLPLPEMHSDRRFGGYTKRGETEGVIVRDIKPGK